MAFGQNALARKIGFVNRGQGQVSRHHRHHPKLPKMFVKRERLPDTQPLYDHGAGAVGEALLFVVVSPKDLPRIHKVPVVDRDYFREEVVNYLAAKLESMLILAAGAKQCQRFIDNIIGGNKWFPHRCQKSLGVLVIVVTLQGRCLPGTRVDEDHGAP